MGRREANERLELIRAETAREMEAVKEAGGNINFLFAYHDYLNELQSGDCETAVLTGQRFLRRPLQIAAVTAVKDQKTLAAHKDDIPDFDETLSNRVEAVARTAYVSAAGHYEEPTLAHLPEASPEATARKQKAAADWDRLLRADLPSLVHLSIWGKEASNSSPMTFMDHIKGIGSLVIFAVLVVIIYYVWAHRS